MRTLVYMSAIIVGAASCSSSLGTRNTGAGGDHASNAVSSSSGSASANGGAAASSGSMGTSNGGSTGTLMLGDSGPGPCPAYQSCASLGDNCGMAPDGCGNVQDCGTCSSAESCGGGGKPNVCGTPACTKQTCITLGYNCGAASDGCGGTIDCGSCASGQTCGATSANVCGAGNCTPQTCAQQGFNCGMQGDGCGNVLDCGSCATGQVCGGGSSPQTGVCGTQTTCTPQTCAQQGFNCGMATDGCGNVIDCTMGTTCPSGEVCGGQSPNVCGGSCSAAAQLVYVWADDGTIYSFDPPTKVFTKVAVPDCDADTPNSMAIDRNLVAWLNYLDPGSSSPNDYIYKFDLTKGSGCQASGIQIPTGFTQVGMGFSTDTAGGTTETLYIDGIGGAGLAKVDMTNLTVVPIGKFANDSNLTGQSCELTGTGNAGLFGYFTTSPYVRVVQLDKTNANSLSDNVLNGFTPPDDWAFSFWGGDFYLYAYPLDNQPTSSVVHYTPSSGALDLQYIPSVGFTIIGAGVSTCAPTCTPQTCAQAGASCGPARDGCGNILQCGTCPSGQTCTAGTCEGCAPKTCSSQGFACGMQGDGCGNALDCGSCPSGQSCAEGKCTNSTCTPKSCAQLGYTCGSFGDGCGNLLNCGTCATGQVCGGTTVGQCDTPSCTPKNCIQLGFNCGAATDGCGNIINCGTCSAGETCGGNGMANVCGTGAQ